MSTTRLVVWAQAADPKIKKYKFTKTRKRFMGVASKHKSSSGAWFLGDPVEHALFGKYIATPL